MIFTMGDGHGREGEGGEKSLAEKHLEGFLESNWFDGVVMIMVWRRMLLRERLCG